MSVTGTLACEYCRDAPALRRVEVLVGALPGRVVPLLIDVEPHPDGRVIERLDGQFRLLSSLTRRKDGVAGYRVHGASMYGECAGYDPEDD
jgi:hypothetical protein